MEISEAWDKILPKLDMVEDEEAINVIKNNSNSEITKITEERDMYKNKYDTLSEQYRKRFTETFTPMGDGGMKHSSEQFTDENITFADIDIFSGKNE